MIILKQFISKIRLPLSIVLSAVTIICISALTTAILSGRENNIYMVDTVVSQVDESHIEKVCDVIKIDKLWLPSEFSEMQVTLLTVSTCRKYTEYEVLTQDFTLNVRHYNYAYLTEDEPVAIPDNADELFIDGVEILIYANTDGSGTALYYKDATRYMINSEYSVQQLKKFFN